MVKILFGNPSSAFVRKPRILLQEKNIDFITDPVSPLRPLTDEFKAISPLKKIPVFKDEDYVIADSSAICAYIDKQYPKNKFYPDDSKLLGKVLWFEEYADTTLFQAIAPCYYQTVLLPFFYKKQPDYDKINHALTNQLPQVATYLNKQLRSTYITGEVFTVADVAIASPLFNMCQSGYSIDKQKWPKLAAYCERIFSRASFQSCVNDIKIELESIKA